MDTFSKPTKSSSFDEFPVHGDVLETIVSRVTLLDLAPLSFVSKSWNEAVSSTLLNSNKRSPWLILHTQRTRSPHVTTTYAYDASSEQWICIKQPPLNYNSALYSSNSNFIYTISPTKFSFSFDPLHLTWHNAEPPKFWRLDPLVCKVGNHIVIAGGSCNFEDYPLPVKVYDLVSKTWSDCSSIPASLDYPTATMHSAAANETQLFIMDRGSCVMHIFSVETKSWRGPFHLRPDVRCVSSAEIGIYKAHLILTVVIKGVDGTESVTVYRLKCDFTALEEIGEMPEELVEKLRGESYELESIGLCLAGNVAYMYKRERAENVVIFELEVDGGCRWSSVKNVAANDRSLMTERFVFTSFMVGVEELKTAVKCGKRKFVKSS